MNEMFASWSAQTRKVEDAIWARRKAFEKRFCRGEELLEIRLTSDSVKPVFLTELGGTWTDSFPLKDLSQFFQDNPSP